MRQPTFDDMRELIHKAHWDDISEDDLIDELKEKFPDWAQGINKPGIVTNYDIQNYPFRGTGTLNSITFEHRGNIFNAVGVMNLKVEKIPGKPEEEPAEESPGYDSNLGNELGQAEEWMKQQARESLKIPTEFLVAMSGKEEPKLEVGNYVQDLSSNKAGIGQLKKIDERHA